MSDLFIEAWGTGAPVVLVHGSLATGAEWQAQQPLAEQGYQLLVLDRRGYGESPAVEGEDFLRDAADIAHVIGDGAHVVAHSYGGLGAMFAAAQRPEAIDSLALLEPAASALASTDAARRDHHQRPRRHSSRRRPGSRDDRHDLSRSRRIHQESNEEVVTRGSR